MIGRALFFITCLLLSAMSSAASREIVLDSAFEKQEITRNVDYFVDASSRLTVNEIQQLHTNQFKPFPRDSIGEGYQSGTWWFRFALFNNEQASNQWWLNLAYAMLDFVDVYQINGDSATAVTVARSGDKLSYATRLIGTHDFSFPLTLPSQVSVTILLRVQTSGSMVVPLRLYKEATYITDLANQRLLLGIYHGGAFFLMLYNIGLLLIVRERLYLYYVFYVASFLMISLNSTGLGYEYIWQDHLWFQSGALPFIILVCNMFGVLFSRNLLALKDRSTLLFHASNALLVLNAVIFLACILFSYTAGIQISMLATFLSICFVVTAGCHGILTRFGPARIFMIAWIAFLVSAIIFILNAFNLMDASTLSLNSLQLGSAAELLLLSFSTASRISHIKTQKTELETAARIEKIASNAKSDFLASMSHEIRAPMAGVLGMTELMGNTPLTNEQRQYLDNIQASSQALLDIINQILDLSKIEANRLELESLSFSLDSVVDEALKVFYARRQHSRVNLELQIDPTIPAQVRGDPTRLRQILINLIGNAFKFTEKGSITITIKPDKQTHHLYFSVSDTSPGITADVSARLFQHHDKGSAATQEHAGTRLDLDITRQLVERMGGEIGVHSQPGTGSTFWFILPLMTIENAPPILPANAFSNIQLYLFSNDNSLQRQVSQWCKHTGIEWVLNAWPKGTDQIDDLVILSDDIIHLRQSQSLLACRVSAHLLYHHHTDNEQTEFPATELPLLPSRFLDILAHRQQTDNASPPQQHDVDAPVLIKRVLLAEDNPVNAQVIKGLLKRLGVESDWCQNGKEAVEKASRNQYDLIFMDCEMPILDGYGATRQIRESGETTLPIVALTAHAVKEYVDQAYDAGMNDYLTKPVDLATLRKTLQFWSSPIT